MTSAPTPASEQTVSLTALIALVIGSMVGAGIFTLPSKFASASGGNGRKRCSLPSSGSGSGSSSLPRWPASTGS